MKNFHKSFMINSRIYTIFKIFNPQDRRKILGASVVQVALSLLDLVVVALIGAVVALASSVEGSSTVQYVRVILKTTNVSHLDSRVQILVLGLFAVSILIFKSLVSLFYLRRITFFLSRRGADLSRTLLSKFLGSSLIEIQERSFQESLFALTSGVATITQGVVARLIAMVSDFATLTSIIVGLFFLDKIIAFSSVSIFGFLGIALYFFFRKKAKTSGRLQSEITIRSNREIYEVLGSFRETYVKNRGSFFAEVIGKTRLSLADTQARLGFMSVYSKYIMDVAVTLGAVVVAVFQFYFIGGAAAIASLGLFLAAGTKLAPSILRLQQNAIELKVNLAGSEPTLRLHKSLRNKPESAPYRAFKAGDYVGFKAMISMKNIFYSYPGSDFQVLKDVSLEVNVGEYCAIVGESGAGKSTLVDIMLGIIKPDQGIVKISDYSPNETVSTWPGAIGYVPQDVQISLGSIRENVALGYPFDANHESSIWEALEIARLSEFVKSLPLGLDTQVGDRGTKLSGGQRQRLGIARAMFTKPELLILDEATSSLDLKTELEFSDALRALAGKITIVVVAHRAATIELATTVFEISGGILRAVKK